MIGFYLHVIIGIYYLAFFFGFALISRGLFYRKVLSSIVGFLFVWNSTYMIGELFKMVKEIY